MREIPLSAEPGQTLTLNLENARYVLTIKEARGVMMCDIAVNDAVLVTGGLVLAGEMLIPYEYLEAGGNFILQTTNEDLPDWRQFGLSQGLYFLTAAELEIIRA